MPKSPEWSSDAPRPEDPLQEDREEDSAKGEVLPVSDEFLGKFCTSVDFISNLNETARQVRKYGGREFGFGFWKHLRTDQTIFTGIVGGPSENSVGIKQTHDELESQLEKTGSQEKYIILGTFHFHPGVGRDPIIIPSGSGGDLGQSYLDRDRNRVRTDYDSPTIEMIAVRIRGDKLKILLYQEPLHYEPMQQPAIKEELDETLRVLRETKGAAQEEVMNALRHYGYKAEVVHSVGTGISAVDLTTIRTFSFTPKRIETRD